MNFKLIAVSGLGPKEPAAFLVEADGLRLLLDLGQGQAPTMRPDPATIGRVDALVLSHAHKDHCGALDLLAAIGDPVVYATHSVLDRIGKVKKARELPAVGPAEVLGIPVETGRDGHALGGVWIRFDLDGGLLYMGDNCTESEVFVFDDPPPSRFLVLDASYGEAEETREAQARDILATAASGRTHFPVPADGRGLEMAVSLHDAGMPVAIDEAVRGMLRRVAGPDRSFGHAAAVETAALLAQSAPPADACFPGAILTADAVGDGGASAKLLAARGDASLPAVVFTGHLDEGTRGQQLVGEGRARFRRWNVHPTLSQNAALVRSVGAEIVVPAFGGTEPWPALRRAFGTAHLARELSAGADRATPRDG